MNFFRKLKSSKVINIIGCLFLGILLVLISTMLISDLTWLIFIAIRNTTGYCTPFMEKVIAKISSINMGISEMWDEIW